MEEIHEHLRENESRSCRLVNWVRPNSHPFFPTLFLLLGLSLLQIWECYPTLLATSSTALSYLSFPSSFWFDIFCTLRLEKHTRWHWKGGLSLHWSFLTYLKKRGFNLLAERLLLIHRCTGLNLFDLFQFRVFFPFSSVHCSLPLVTINSWIHIFC